MKYLLVVAGLLLSSCATERLVPPLLQAPRPLNTDSLLRIAQLPAYLVPPPAGSTARQAAKWTAAQTQALASVHAAGKLKLKNVGNSEATTSVQQGITGRQLTSAALIVAVVGLLCWLKPWQRS